MGRNTISVQWLIDTAAATVLGFLAGIGTGGGSLLILWLTLVRGIDPLQAKTYNLLFFIPSALTATFLRRRKSSSRSTGLFPAVAAGCAAAAAVSYLFAGIDTQLLKKLFGCLLIAAGIRELLYKPKV